MKDIRREPVAVKRGLYDDIEARYLRGAKVTLRDHGSGFPAVVVICEDVRIITDILSLEEWRRDNPPREPMGWARSARRILV